MAFLRGCFGGARHIPNRTDTVVRFGPEHVVLFLRLWQFGQQKRHKATIPNGVPQGGLENRCTFRSELNSSHVLVKFAIKVLDGMCLVVYND